MKKMIIKISAFVFSALMCLSFVSCEARPITSSKQALASVGNVGDFEVPYEELYYLTHNYREQLDIKYEGTEISDEAYEKELRELVYENVVANYAVLTLAAEEGITIDSDKVQEDVALSVEASVTNDFNGKRSEYKKSMKKNGLTDSYVRFSYGVDAVYSLLVAEYLDSGVINDSNEYIKEYINTEFARTWHIMMINDGTPDSYARAQEAMAQIESGKTMYQMIGSKYNDDYLLTTLDGYYFPRGTMDIAYENAAFALEIGQISDIVSAKGEDNSGNTVDCYYIIQRLSPEKEYIEKNFDTLKEKYYTSAVYTMVSELQKTLKFVPNSHCEGLDLLALEVPRTVDYVVVVVLSTIAVIIAAVIIVSLLLVKRIKKKNADIIGNRSTKELRASDKK